MVDHDASTDTTFTTTDPATFTHNPTGIPRGVLVAIAHGSSDDDQIDGDVTYGGVELERIVSPADDSGEPGRVYLYFRGERIPPGPQTVSIGHTAAGQTIHVVVATITGDRNLEVVDFDVVEGNVANPSVDLDSGSRTAIRYSMLYSGVESIASTSLGAGMTATQDHDHGGVISRFDRQTTPGSGSATMGYTVSSDDVALAGIAIAEITTAGLYGEDQETALIVEAAFGYSPTDPPGWTDITDRVRYLNFKRGRQHELGRFEAGEATLILDNRDGELNPHNTASSLYPDVKVMVPIRIWAQHDGSNHPLWYGYAESWPPTYAGGADALMTVKAADLFKILALEKAKSDFASRMLALEPLAYWRFSDAGTADETGNGHTLTLEGTPATGTPGNWLGDEGVTMGRVGNDYATIADEVDLELRQDMTIVAWLLNPSNADPADQAIITCRGAGADAPLYELYFQNPTGTDPRYVLYPANSAGTAGASGPVPLTAHLLVVTIEWGVTTRTISFYVNGVLSSTGTYAFQPGALTRAINLNRRATDGDLYAIGTTYSEMAILDRVLTAAEISDLYGGLYEPLGEERTDERIAELLDRLGFPDDYVDLETGQTTMAASDASGSILEEILLAVATEDGAFFQAPNGDARFHDRHYRILTQGTPLAIFDGGGGSELTYFGIQPSYDDSQVWNEVEVTVGANQVFRVQDDASVAAYGTRTLTRTIAPANPSDGLEMANWLKSRYAEPSTRVDQLVIEMGKHPDLWPIVLAGEIGNRYTVKKALTGDDLDLDVYLEAITMTITAQKTWTVTWQLSPAVDEEYWVLGDSDLSLLGQTTILGF